MSRSVFDGSENVAILPVRDNQFGDAAYFEVKDSSEDYRKILNISKKYLNFSLLIFLFAQ